MAKHVQTLLTLAIVGHILLFFGTLESSLVAISAQIVVEEILSFEMSTQTSKSDKN